MKRIEKEIPSARRRRQQRKGKQAVGRGYRAARALAELMGGTGMEGGANVCLFRGVPTAVKTAGPRTHQVCPTIPVLRRVANVHGAFQVAPDVYDVWTLPATACRRMPKHPKYQQRVVPVAYFRRHGTFLGTADLNRRLWTAAP